MTGATSEVGNTYPSWALPVFSGVRVSQSLVLCVMWCLSFCPFSVVCLLFTDSVYPLVSSNSHDQQFHQYQQYKQSWPTIPPISTIQTVMINNSTNINNTNSHDQQFHQYQQYKQSWSTIPPISTIQTVMINNSTNINNTNSYLLP